MLRAAIGGRARALFELHFGHVRVFAAVREGGRTLGGGGGRRRLVSRRILATAAVRRCDKFARFRQRHPASRAGHKQPRREKITSRRR